MDSSIDRVNQALTGKTTRRQAFRLLGGGMIAGVAGGAALTAGLKEAAAQRQQQDQLANVGQLVSGLINVNIGAVQLALETGDISVLSDLVDVTNVLNSNDIRILNNVLNNSPILSNNSDILTNLLRDANILNGVQVVVGVLSGIPVFQNVQPV